MLTNSIPQSETILEVRLASKHYRYLSIPQDIRSCPQWVLWKKGTELRNGGYRQLPIDPKTRNYADTTNSRTWGTYQCAIVAHAKEHKSFEGLGFVVSREMPYSFLDFDNCINEGIIDKRVRDIIDRFPGSYVEISPSDNGIKMLIRGKLPGPCKRTDWVECYDRDHYTTLTANV